MKQMITRFVLLTIGIVLLVMIGLPETRPTTAAPLLVVTGTPQEPPTREPPTEAPPSTSVPPSQPTEKPSRHKVGDPAVTKSVNPTEARIGDEVVFTLDVTDRGEKDATDVVVRDEIPDYLDIIETTASRGAVSTEGRTVIVNIGTITPDEQITITIRTRVNERAQPPGGRNVATLTTTSLANDPSNDTSEVTFRIVVD